MGPRLVDPPPNLPGPARAAVVPGGPVYSISPSIWAWLTGKGPFPWPRPKPAPTPPPPTPPPIPPVPGSVSDQVIAALNVERARYRLSALASDPRLVDAAQSWATVMARADRLYHGDFAARMNAVYPNTAAGEIIAEGATNVDAVVRMWMGSPPHRANILDAQFNRAGSGLQKSAGGAEFWCVDFVG